MSDQLSNFLPWVSFLAGLGGGLHCIGMCGGLVTASCERTSDVARYQIGRLLGYLLLGLLSGSIGSLLNIKAFPLISVASGILIGALFVFWGVQNFRGKKAELPAPEVLGKIYGKLWFRLVHKNRSRMKPLVTGFISLLLPCGLLYGVVIGTVALENRGPALVSMLFFWLGTLPSMVAAPQIVHKMLKPFKAKLPKTYALTLVTIGLITISFRVAKLRTLETNTRHSGELTHKSCH